MSTLTPLRSYSSIDRLGYTKSSSSLSAPSNDNLDELITINEDGTYLVSLPDSLRAYQSELERLIGKVFNGRPTSGDNLALARQMSLNWCASKCRQNGMELEKCLTFLS